MGNTALSAFKRIVAVAAALALVASCLLCSCTGGANASNNSANASNTTNAATASNSNTGKSASKTTYKFRTNKLLNTHYEKHGKEMGFKSAAAYEAAASDVVNNPKALHKLEKEDNDDVYYLEDTNDFVIVSTDGYLRTYFWPNGGKAYFDRQ